MTGPLNFKKARNSVNSEIKLAKKAHYMNALHENESSSKKRGVLLMN